MKTFIHKTAMTSIALLVLLLGGTTAAYATTPSQTLSVSVNGGVSNLGKQTYSMSGGTVAFAEIYGQPVVLSSANLQYSMKATVSGLNTQGSGSFKFVGVTTSNTRFSVSGSISIGSMIPAAQFPAGCTTDCQSALPFFFIGTSNVAVSIPGSSQTLPEVMQIESPYFNPFGAPIVIASADNAIVIAATYTKGSIAWSGTNVVGAINGTLGTTPVSGTFSMTSGENENMVTGTATDSGIIAFSSMTPSSLNVQGSYSGSSTIPLTGSYDCSAATGIPGTCTETGFLSTGTFSMKSASGTYSTTWGIPALGFTSSISATVS